MVFVLELIYFSQRKHSEPEIEKREQNRREKRREEERERRGERGERERERFVTALIL